jgi:hypothetical protein
MICSRQSRENGPEVRDGRESPEIAALSGSLPKAPGSAGGYLLMVWTAYTVVYHVLGAIPRLDETILYGDGGIAKNIGVVSWINSNQAAWDHNSALAVIIVLRPSCRSGAENA